MKPFTLHAVLKYRQQLEDMARQRLYQALEVEARLLEALLEVNAELAELYSSLRWDQEHGTTVDRLILFDHRIELVKEEAARRQTELDKQQVQVENKRKQLIKTSKDRKIMEKIREQQNAAYAKYLEKKEAGMLDEIAVLSHARKQQR
ncbi:MAG: flagellar export protein FliJ [Desulfobulbaceae bacterium]|nr:flagellar export protein FliJ [Desulfobulbaceae bacterium]